MFASAPPIRGSAYQIVIYRLICHWRFRTSPKFQQKNRRSVSNIAEASAKVHLEKGELSIKSIWFLGRARLFTSLGGLRFMHYFLLLRKLRFLKQDCVLTVVEDSLTVQLLQQKLQTHKHMKQGFFCFLLLYSRLAFF